MVLYDGQSFQLRPRVVIVNRGDRGARGIPGTTGEQGPKGDSFEMLGPWNSGSTYCPLNAVTHRSSLTSGVNSLYIQKDAISCSVSTVPPNEDLNRWVEVGAASMRNAFGGIWQVTQLNHGFTMVGQPVGYSFEANRYILADARRQNTLAIAMVKEVVNANVVFLQSTGEVQNIDAGVITEGGDWQPGVIYYTSTTPGYLSAEPPQDVSYWVNPILIPTDEPGGVRAGVVLPWTPFGNAATRAARQLVGNDKYYYTASGTQAVFEGEDEFGNTLSYDAENDQLEVFVNGLNIRESRYDADDGTSIQFTTPLSNGNEVEVWVPSQGTVPAFPAAASKVDSLETFFTGSRTEFPLTVNGTNLPMMSTMNIRIWIDAAPQEPLVDYEVIAGEDDAAVLKILSAPPSGARFWGLVLQEVGGGGGGGGGGDGITEEELSNLLLTTDILAQVYANQALNPTSWQEFIDMLIAYLGETEAEVSSRKLSLADGLASIQKYASGPKKFDMYRSYTALSVSERAQLVGEMWTGQPDADPGPAQGGELAAFDEFSRGTGLYFTPAEIAAIFDGDAGELPQDPEAMRAVREYYDATADIAAGALALDFRGHPNSYVEVAADLDLSFLELPASSLGQGIGGRVEIKNTSGSQKTITFILADTGMNDVVPVNGLGSDLDVPAGETRAIYVALAKGGWLEIAEATQTAP